MITTKVLKPTGRRKKYRVQLEDGRRTTVYVARYDQKKIKTRIVHFDEPTELLNWCRQHRNIAGAVTGGYFLRKGKVPIGEMQINGIRLSNAEIPQPYGQQRGTFYASPEGSMTLARRCMLPRVIKGYMLQAGPLLVENGQKAPGLSIDIEGFGNLPGLHDPDSIPTDGRFPRVGIGIDVNYIWTVACDGRSEDEAGLSVEEFAEVFTSLGVSEALNLDGGSSATLIHANKLINAPRGGIRDHFRIFEQGRPVLSAIIFEGSF